MATIFSHPDINVGTLMLRFSPTEVDWTYNLLTSETNTYAGQVVQLLGVNFESFTIQGQFGLDSRDDYSLQGIRWTRNGPPSSTFSNLGPGLTQLTDYFKRYFAIASQGNAGESDHFNQQPMTITYDGTYNTPIDIDKQETTWKVYPTSFPSYRIANDNFAPEWKLNCQVYEAPSSLTTQLINDNLAALQRLAHDPIYQPGSFFSNLNPSPTLTSQSSPAQLQEAALQALQGAQATASDLMNYQLPTYTPEDIENFITGNFSKATTTTDSANTKIKTQSTSVSGMNGLSYQPGGGGKLVTP